MYTTTIKYLQEELKQDKQRKDELDQAVNILSEALQNKYIEKSEEFKNLKTKQIDQLVTMY